VTGAFSLRDHGSERPVRACVAKLNLDTGDVINAADQPLATYHPDFPNASTWT
jgi:hypothetical protein